MGASGYPGSSILGAIFHERSIEETMKNPSPQNMNFDAKRSQHGVEINAKTHSKSMHKLISKKNMKTMKYHVALKGKIIQTHCKNKCFVWFRRLHTRTERNQQNLKVETKIHAQIYEKSIQISCSKKRYPKH